MKNLIRKLQKHSTAPIAAFMVSWLSGVLFLFCCGTMQEARAADAEFCPLAAKGRSHCDKTKESGDEPIFSAATSHLKFDCCGFLPAVFDKTRKIEKTEQTTEPAAKIKVAPPEFSCDGDDFETTSEYRSIIRKQEKIFIKNCVFRI